MYLLQVAKCLLSACSSRTKATADVPHGVQHLREHHQRGALHIHDHALHSVAVSIRLRRVCARFPHVCSFFLFVSLHESQRALETTARVHVCVSVCVSVDMSSMISRTRISAIHTRLSTATAVDTPPSAMSPPRRHSRARPRGEVTARSRRRPRVVPTARPRAPRAPLRHRPSRAPAARASSSARTRPTPPPSAPRRAGGNSSSKTFRRPSRWWTAATRSLGGHRGWYPGDPG